MEIGVTAVMLPEIDFAEQVALCASAGVRFYQYRPRWIPDGEKGKPFSNWGNHRFDLTPERFLSEGKELTATLGRAGLRPWGTLPDVSADEPDERILLHLRGAAAAGAGRMRLSPAEYPVGPFDYRAFLARVIERYRDVIERLSRPLGIRLLVETHTGSIAASPGLAWNIVQGFDPRDIGVIFDIANFSKEGEVQPALAVSVLHDWIDCVHVGGGRRKDAPRDAAGCRRIEHVFSSPRDSDLHIPTWIKALRDAGLEPPLIIEDFTPDATGPEKVRRDAKFLHEVIQAR